MKKTFLVLLPLILLSSNTQAAQRKEETWQAQRKKAVKARKYERDRSLLKQDKREVEGLIQQYEHRRSIARGTRTNQEGSVHTIQDYKKEWQDDELRSWLKRKDLPLQLRKEIKELLQGRAALRAWTEEDEETLMELKQSRKIVSQGFRLIELGKKTAALKKQVDVLERQRAADRTALAVYGAAVDKEEGRTVALKAAVAELNRGIEADAAALVELDAQIKASQSQLDQWDAQAKAKAAVQWSITKLGASAVCAIVGICTYMALYLKLQKRPKAKAITLPQQEIEKRKDRDGRDEERD